MAKDHERLLNVNCISCFDTAVTVVDCVVMFSHGLIRSGTPSVTLDWLSALPSFYVSLVSPRL